MTSYILLVKIKLLPLPSASLTGTWLASKSLLGELCSALTSGSLASGVSINLQPTHLNNLCSVLTYHNEFS